jgi:ammonium transporter, Amt family
MRVISTLALFLFVFSISSSAFAEEAVSPSLIDKGDTAWMLVSSLLVLMMTLPGLALFYGGLVRKDNILATLMQALGVALVVSLLWPLIGYSLVFTEGSTFIGSLDKIGLKSVNTNSVVGTIPETVFILFQMTFAIIAVAILLGAVADRIKFSAVLVFSGLWMLLVYVPIAHWVWGPSGFLGGVGMTDYQGLFGFGTKLDFAGGTVVHISSGVSGLVAALFIGKALAHEQSNPNNLVLSVMGGCLLWVGWFGFNAGSALSAGQSAGMAMLVTHTAAAVAGLTWVLAERIIKGKPSVVGAISGVVAGLVAITPASGFVGFGASIVFGFLAALICYFAVAFIKAKMKYDDQLDAFGIHGVGGIVGCLLTGVFAASAIGGKSGLLEGNPDQLIAQILGVCVVVIYSAVATLIILFLMKKIMIVRVNEKTEREGLDLALHGDQVEVYK